MRIHTGHASERTDLRIARAELGLCSYRIKSFFAQGDKAKRMRGRSYMQLLVRQQLAMFGRSREDLTFFHVWLQQNRAPTTSHVLQSRDSLTG